MMDPTQIPMLVLIGLVAFLYASVGHGGATGYLAVMSLFGFPPEQMASTALMLNILVAGLSFTSYARAGHFRWFLTWPFLLTSVPMAFVGGMLPLKPGVYNLILAAALLLASWRLALMPERPEPEAEGIPLFPSLLIGSVLGLVSGMIGIGGGIFLSPVILLLGWAGLRHTSATAALFIVVNALAGLGGRLYADTFVLGNLLPYLLVAGVGGFLGARMGAHQWSGRTLKWVLAVVLFLAAFKLALQTLH